MTTSPRLHHLTTLLALLALPLGSLAQNTLVTAKLNGDDQWKIYITTQINTDGYQFASGWGWPITYTSTLWLPPTSAGTHFKDYWLNIWVQDVGGGGPDLLGEFKLTGAPGCKFDNGTKMLLTDASKNWLVTAALPISSGGTPVANFPPPFTTYLPPYTQPTLLPMDLGANGVGPWGFMPGINAAARWMTDPANTSNMEAWFQAHIRCK
ncbi:MAG TPA: hypothetical protein VGQ91_02240 [Ideonella sp.]|jgi:hypothetical protein|nr:hypothetical protein [Ideonella sp.]